MARVPTGAGGQLKQNWGRRKPRVGCQCAVNDGSIRSLNDSQKRCVSMMYHTTMLIIVLSFLLVVTSAGECPAHCECRSYIRDIPDHLYTTLKCSSDLKSYDLPDNTEEVIFENGKVEDFSNLLDNLRVVQSLPYFSRLILTGIALPNISNVSVSSLDRLRILVLSNCGLKYLPEFNLTSLQNLDLSGNELEVIEDEQFRTLPVLDLLNLSVNAIRFIHFGGFAGLTGLKCLDLSRNNLSELGDNVFSPLVTLQHLNLSNNKLEVLNEACFSSLLYLQQLDVSWNRLSRVAPGSLQLPSLARLLLEGNPQLGNSKEQALFVGTGKLQTVDASRTGLKQVPAALTHSIRTLRLAGNSISSINCGDLDSYPLLQLLDFTSNQLIDIEEDAMGRLDSLTVLYLTDNKLPYIPHSLPEKLRVLHLENNEIKYIQAGDLQNLPQLETLLLTRNKISSIKETPFNQLISLSSLDLSHNPIMELPPGSLVGPTRLRVLRLAGLNVISKAKATSFPLSTPEHLITLDLSNSPGLAHQMLADTAALAASRELQELDLSNSNLIYIRSDLIHFLPQLRVLHLHDNPLNCTNLQWLAEWMRRQDEPEYRIITCISPPELYGTLLVDLQNIEIETTTRITTTTTTESTTTNKIISTVSNVKQEITAKYIVEYHPMNISPPGKSSQVNDVLKEPSNLFMKKSLHKYEVSTIPIENSTAEMSMYSSHSHQKSIAHPGMLILTICTITSIILIIILTHRFNKKRQPPTEDIEVSSLPSVTELW